jgi:protein-L-isoaspartate(D-aspartate) O-methyltransferase
MAGHPRRPMSSSPRFADLRARMVEQQLRARGVRDERVLDAMGRVPREEFVGHDAAAAAYDDRALSIGGGQTISQPYVVALTLAAADIAPDDDVLDVGTGSGYAAAVASHLARRVWTVERDAELAALAAERLRRLGYANVHVAVGDGARGWPAHAPYGAVVAAAAGADVPSAWIDQLADGGRIVAPIGTPDSQHLVGVARRGTRLVRETLAPVRYVPLVGGDDEDPVELP